MSIIDIFGLDSNRFISEKDMRLKEDVLTKSENWETVNAVIKIRSSEGIEWIKHAIEHKQEADIFRIRVRKVHFEIYMILKKYKGYMRKKRTLFRMRLMRKETQKKVVCFGAGKYGLKAIDKFNKNDIAFFIDNSKHKMWLADYPVLTMKEASKIISKSSRILITTSAVYQNEISKQLLELGYSNLEFYDAEK